MRECPRSTPWHCEHQMYRYAQCLSAMNMCKTGWICDNCLRHERYVCSWIRLDTRFPTSFQHFANHFTLSGDVTSAYTGEFWNDTWVFDHILINTRLVEGSFAGRVETDS